MPQAAEAEIIRRACNGDVDAFDRLMRVYYADCLRYATRMLDNRADADGIHHIALRIDGGTWCAPPGLPATPDEFGGETGVFEVR